MTVTILYFAHLRERIGASRERIDTQAQTVTELVEELKARDDMHAAAFDDLASLRVAVDQVLVDFDAPLNAATEIAFFPPMTGG